MKRRLPVQIVVATSGGAENFRERLYALADDGTIWRMDDSDLCNGRSRRKLPGKRSNWWKQLLPLPGVPDPAGVAASPQENANG